MNKLYISMYHYVRDLKNSRYPEIKGLDKELFYKQLCFFKENFNVVTMEDVIAASKNEKELPEKALLLTFDDGYIDHYTVAFPLLKEFGFQGSFFVPGKTFTEHKLLDVNKVHFILASVDDHKTIVKDIMDLLDEYRKNRDIPSNEELYEKYGTGNRFDGPDTVFCKRVLQTGIDEDLRNEISSYLFKKYVGMDEEVFARELYMNKEQMQLMKYNGMFFGIHGYDHYWLCNLKEDEMEKDIEMALKSMEGLVDKNEWIINYPYGSYSQNVVDYVSKKGCVLGFSTEVRIADMEKDGIYILPRLDCNDFPPKSENYRKFED